MKHVPLNKSINLDLFLLLLIESIVREFQDEICIDCLLSIIIMLLTVYLFCALLT